MIKEVLKRLMEGRNISYTEAVEVLSEIMSGTVSDELIASFLTALAMRPVSGEELAGFASAMRKFALPINVKSKPIIDTCGMGGDHKGTFNISTTVAFVCSGAGVKVAKHGNRSATSLCGSADVLEQLGVIIDLPPEKVAECIETVGIGFIFARKFHPAMKNVGKVRSELPFPTIFNMIGPLCNPVLLDAQVLGVFSEKLLEPVAEALQLIGVNRAFVVWGSEGLDEISPCAHTKVIEIKEGKIRRYIIRPQDFDVKFITLEQIKGGSIAENAQILRSVLSGEHSPYRDVVLLNSAPALIAAGLTEDWREAIKIAEDVIDSGEALAKLDHLVTFSKHLAK